MPELNAIGIAVSDMARSEKEPWDPCWGQCYVLLIDPDGVRVNLYAPL